MEVIVALQGTLDTFSLTDVLTLLASTRKSGRLWVDDNHRSGSVWLLEGTVVAAGMDDHLDQEPVAVVFELLRSLDGAFLFEADIPSPYEAPGDTVADVLEKAQALHAEWEAITAVVPSAHRLVTLAPELAEPEVIVDAARWRVLVAIAGGRTVAELGDALGLTELEACRTVKDVVEAGLVALSADDVAYDVIYEDVEHGVDAYDEAAYDDDPEAGASETDTFEAEGFEPDTIETETYEVDAFGETTERPYEPGSWALDAPTEPVATCEVGAWAFEAATETVDDAAAIEETGAGEAEETSWGGWDPLAPSAPTGLEDAWAAESTAPAPLLSFGSPLPPPASLAEALGTSGEGGDPGAELGELTPQAARAIAAAAQAQTEAERDAALAEAVDQDNEPIDRGLLLRFLSSVKQ